MKKDHCETVRDMEPTMRRVDLADVIAQCGQTGGGTMKSSPNKKARHRRQTIADKLAKHEAALALEVALGKKFALLEKRRCGRYRNFPAAMKVRPTDHALFPMFNFRAKFEVENSRQQNGYFSAGHIAEMRCETWHVLDEDPAPAPSAIGTATRSYHARPTSRQRRRADSLIAAFDRWQARLEAADDKWEADPVTKQWPKAVDRRYVCQDQVLKHPAVDLMEVIEKASFIISIASEIEDDAGLGLLVSQALASDLVRLCPAGSAVAQ